MNATLPGAGAQVRLLILGTGGMAAKHAEEFAGDPRVDLAAAVDIDQARLAAFARSHNIGTSFADLDSAIAWDGFDAVANVTPDAVHHPTTMALIAAGKHVFCEKPLAENHSLADEMAAAAEAAGLIHMVNLTYRGVREVQKARQIVADGRLGRIRHVNAAYWQSWLVGDYWGDWRTQEKWLWRLSTAHGSSGALGDIGIHIVDTALFVSGLELEALAGRLHTFDKHETGRIDDYVLDANDAFTISAKLSGGAVGIVQASRTATGYANRQTVSLFGDRGSLELSFGMRDAGLKVCLGDNRDTLAWETVDCPDVPTNYRRFADAVCSGRNGTPDFRHAADLQKILDLCRTSDAQGGTMLPLRWSGGAAVKSRGGKE